MKKNILKIIYALGISISIIYIIRLLIAFLMFGTEKIPPVYLVTLASGCIFLPISIYCVFNPRRGGILLILFTIIYSASQIILIIFDKSYILNINNIFAIILRSFLPMFIIGLALITFNKSK